jgi:diacylglycerol kinase
MHAIIKSFRYAVHGIKSSFNHRNVIIEGCIAVLVVIAGFYFQIEGWEWCIIILCIGFVIALEIMNSAIENTVNLITSEWLPLAGKIKDLAAGAVLIASVASVIAGIIIFYKYLIQLFIA